ncbi:hypothetical protein HKX48_008265, partial [Thoreauomyces humboldtii]
LVLRWLDPSRTGAGSPVHRLLRWVHLGVILAATLSVYGGIKLANTPVTDQDRQQAKTYRTAGVAIMLVMCAVMGLVLVNHAIRHRSIQPFLRRSAVFLAACIALCALRAALSLYFVSNTNAILEEKYLYGLAIVPELPLLFLLCFTPCLRWFEYHADVQAAIGPYGWVPGVISNRLDRANPNWRGSPYADKRTSPAAQQAAYTTYDSQPYPMGAQGSHNTVV